MEQESWISRTQQFWKVHVLLGLLLITLISFGGVLWKTNESVESAIFGLGTIELVLIFIGMAGSTFSWMWFAFQCPECHQSVGKWVMRHSSFNTCFTDLISLGKCPHCGYSG